MTTGVWETLKGEAIIDSAESMTRQIDWTAGLTRRGKPPRDQTARARRQLLAIVLGWGLAGAGLLRVLQLLGVV